MDIYCNPAELQHQESVVIIDMSTKKESAQPFKTLANGSDFFPVKVVCEDDQSRTVMVPVYKILVYPIGKNGQLSSSGMPKALLVEYFDKQGKMLESNRLKGSKPSR